jgi:signal transduction histidine kinase
VGPRLAIQGRRYLGPARRWSAFATGGAALLVGRFSNDDTRFVSPDNLLETQSVGGTLVVPNFDIALGTGLDARQRDYVQKIRTAGASLLGIIDDILDVSKLEAGRITLERIPLKAG